MAGKLTILTLAFFIIAVPIKSGFCARKARKSLLRDGFVVRGVDGKLTKADSNGISERWFFEFDSDISDGKGRVKAGSIIGLLPSAALEKMTADAKKRSDANYRLWGRVTKYRGRNFIFPVYFLPIGKAGERQSPTSQKSQQQKSKPTERAAKRSKGRLATQTPSAEEGTREPVINEPNDVLDVPQEIIEKLKARRIVRPKQLRKGPELKQAPLEVRHKGATTPRGDLLLTGQDSILADKIGFIRDSGQEVSFVLDSLGRNVQQVSLLLLPCEALERAERKQSAEPDPLRFKISGIATKYKGKYYLLLQKATQVYSHENFGR